MTEFFNQIGVFFTGFPIIILLVIAPPCGSICASAVIWLIGGENADSPKKLAAQFLVGWFAGAFCGPFFAPAINAPPYTIGFLSGAGGYLGMWKYIKNKREDVDKPSDK